MLSGQLKRLFGPAALTNTLTTNIYNDSSTKVYTVLKQILVANKSSSAVTFTMYLGASVTNAAGTELFYGVSIQPNTTIPFYFQPGLKIVDTEFLVGGASAATSLTITGMGELVAV